MTQETPKITETPGTASETTETLGTLKNLINYQSFNEKDIQNSLYNFRDDILNTPSDNNKKESFARGMGQATLNVASFYLKNADNNTDNHSNNNYNHKDNHDNNSNKGNE